MCPPGASRFSSAGVPWATSRPWSSTAIWSASWSASSRYCVVSRTVTPPATSSRISCHMLCRLRGSSPVVGSSRKMIRGLPTSVIARSSRRFMPPEYVIASFLPASTRSNCSSNSAARRRPSVRPRWLRSAIMIRFSPAGQQTVDRGELAGDADRGADRLRVAACRSCPATRISPASAVISVDRIWTTVVLPAPFGPSRAKMVPSATFRSMPSRTSLSPYDLCRPGRRSPGMNCSCFLACFRAG